METIVWIDDKQLHASGFKKELVKVSGSEDVTRKLSFSFEVSTKEYHDVAILLYKNDFHVRVPALDLAFQAIIYNYATDRTDLYKAGQVADYYLELIEKSR